MIYINVLLIRNWCGSFFAKKSYCLDLITGAPLDSSTSCLESSKHSSQHACIKKNLFLSETRDMHSPLPRPVQFNQYHALPCTWQKLAIVVGNRHRGADDRGEKVIGRVKWVVGVAIG